MKFLLSILAFVLWGCTISEYDGTSSNASGYDDYGYDYDYDYGDDYGYENNCCSSLQHESSSSVIKDSFSGFSSSSKTVFETKSFTDSRNNRSYAYVTIGTQIWMAENLNYASDDSYCYRDDASYCAEYGRMYSFESAQKACPSGWHLPSYNEWAELNNYIVTKGYRVSKALRSTSWYGDDTFGFAALPGGYCYYPTYMDVGYLTSFWSSTKESSLYGYAFEITNSSIGLSTNYHDFRNYVRCVKD